MKLSVKLLIILFLASVTFAQAQKRKRRMRAEERIEKFTEFLTETLSLDEDQRAEVQKILEAEAPRIKAIHKKYPGKENRAKRRELKKPIFKETANKIRELLNEEQQEKFEAMIPGWRKKAREWYREKYGKREHEDEDMED